MRSTHRNRLSPPRRHLRNSLDLLNRDVDHHAKEILGNLYELNSLDHADLPRRQNKNVDDLKGTSTTLSTSNWGVSMEN